MTGRRMCQGLIALIFVTISSSTLIKIAQAEYPEKSVRVIVPFAAGGGSDQVARALATGMSGVLGQSVIVENKPGAGTVIGSDFVAKSLPDGYTVLLATMANAVNPGLLAKLPYGSNKAFIPVAILGRGPNILVVRADSPLKSVQDVIVAAQANPQKLTYSSQGVGTSAHLAGEMFTNLTKIELTHIPYKGSAPAMTDVMGGQVDMTFGTSSALVKHIQSGRFRALGVTSPQRVAALKDIPTIAEQGVPGYSVESWYGLFVPAATPQSIVEKLNRATRETVSSKAFRELAESEGLTVGQDSPEQFQSYVSDEEARWKKIITENKIQSN